MATDPYKYRCTPSEAEELHTSPVLGLNIWRSSPVPENARQLPIDQANVVPFDRAYAVRMLDDDDGNARWTSEDALYVNRLREQHAPRLHPAAEPHDQILQRMNGFDRSRVHGVNTTYLPDTIQPPRPAETDRMSDRDEAKFDPAQSATIESALQALREQQRPDQEPFPSQHTAPLDDVANVTASPETMTTPERSRMSIASLLSPTESDHPSKSNGKDDERSTGTAAQSPHQSRSFPPVSSGAAQADQEIPSLPVTSRFDHLAPAIEPSPRPYRPIQDMPPPTWSRNPNRPISRVPPRYPPAPIFPALPAQPNSPTPLRQMSSAGGLNSTASNSSAPLGGSQVSSGRVTKPSSLRPRGGGMSPARQEVFNRFFEEQKEREAAGPPPTPPRMSDFYAPPSAQPATSPAPPAPLQAPQSARAGVANGSSLQNAGMQSNSSTVWEDGEQDPKLKKSRLNDVTNPEYEAVINDDEPE